MSAQQIRQRIDQILHYMDEGYWDFVNCHMVNFLTHNHWNFVPVKIRNEIQNSHDAKCCIEEALWNNSIIGRQRFPNFIEFISTSQKYTMNQFSEIITNKKELYNYYNIKELSASISVKEFLTDKKVHEVERMAELVHNLSKNYAEREQKKDLILVDIGDGKGYLSSRLALEYKYQVVGVDQSESNTKNALERGRKLHRVWPGLVERAKCEKYNKEQLPSESKNNCNSIQTEAVPRNTNFQAYTTVSKFVTPEMDILNVLQQQDLDSSEKIKFAIVGLHTCGNLASTCLRLYNNQLHCELLCNVGCCYHLLEEAFEKNGSRSLKNTEYGFPMSKYLYDKHIHIGRNARMLAAQSIERTLNAKELPNISLFYRALLELLISSPNATQSIKVGKIKKFTNFVDYAHKSGTLKDIEITQNALEDLEQKHKDNKSFLDVFYLLRMSFAPILESLILLDRLLYLKELGYENSYIIPLFDPIISPRRFSIISIKNSHYDSAS